MEITDVLTFDEKSIDPSLPTGLWFCDNVIEVSNVGANAVCLGLNASWDDIGKFEAWFSQFKYVFVAIANKARRMEAVKELRGRLQNIPLAYATDAAFKGYNSIEALRKAVGYDQLGYLLSGAIEVPPPGLVNIADVKPIDMTRVPKTLSGITALDAATGGFLFGDVTVWTGKRGQGKSTATGQVLLKGIDDGNVGCLYSGELRIDRVKNWLYLQAAGPNNVVEQKDRSGRSWYITPPSIVKEIDEWLNKRLFLYDTSIASAHNEDRIMSLFEYAVKRYECRIFVIDNLMTTNLKRMSDSDYYRAQSQFVGRCKAFAEAKNVHVHIIAHPKKTDGKKEVDDDDISGSGDIGNRADNIIAVQRFPKNDSRGDTGLSLLKARWTGETENVGLKFDSMSKRLYATNGGTPYWRYGWEQARQEKFVDMQTEQTPFDGG